MLFASIRDWNPVVPLVFVCLSVLFRLSALGLQVASRFLAPLDLLVFPELLLVPLAQHSVFAGLS